ncbi:DUF2512 family protein [Paenibacillus sp. SAF-054]|uniref:DUF2512 family protein n=1 Tax=unclassified Paenibacillus TaxID=185978 RepID=UPI003F7FCDB2
MMKLIAKLLVHAVVITALLVALSNASIGAALIGALIIGIVSYLLGDLLILPRTNNMVATLSDAILVYAMLWIVSSFASWTLSYVDMLIIAVVAGVFEFFYHIWLLNDHEPVRRQQAR